MDSGSYNNVRRGTMPLPSAGSNTSYKANVNRTKTRKWVEAKVQNYDGDDWGNDYDDDYDDGDDQPYEPEPMPPKITKPTGLRQPGQTGLPSTRTFSQPSTTLWSSADSRVPGPSSLRSPSGPPSLHVQTQPTATGTPPPPHAVESAHPATTSSHTNVPPGSYSAGPTTVPSRFPPRKSSMGQQDRPDIDSKQVSKLDTRPGSSSSNRIVRPADIYKRVGEEKEKERVSMESGRPSLDSIHNRSDAQFRAPGDQRRRTSLESHDGSDSARTRKPSLAPVAERKSEYGMDGFLAKAQADQPSTAHEPAVLGPQLAISQGEPNDELKADLMKSRRFSTSPQLPTLSRMSGFGDDFFSGPGNNSAWASPSLVPSPDKQSPLLEEPKTMAVPNDEVQQDQPLTTKGSTEPDPATTIPNKHEVKTEGTTEANQPQLGGNRPQLPGGWVSESTTVPVYSEGVILANQQQETHGGVHSTNTATMTKSDRGIDEVSQVTTTPSLSAPANAVENVSDTTLASVLRAKETTGDADRHDNGISLEDPATKQPNIASQSLPPLETQNLTDQLESQSRPTSTVAYSSERDNPQVHPASTDQPTAGHPSGPEFSPTAPLNPNRSQADQPDLLMASHQRQSTIDTVETASSEKESDKLREEIMKSLSPTPISPGSNDLPTKGNSNTAPTPGNLTRESTYLSGVYDDYLSLSEEKSLQELSQAHKASAHMISNEPATAANVSTSLPHDIPLSQPAPLSPVKSPASENTTRLRRFSWQQDPEEMALNHAESKPAVPVISPHLSTADQVDAAAEPGFNANGVSPVADPLSPENGTVGTISHQVSQVSSLTPDASLAPIELPSPVSFAATRRPNPISDVPSAVRLSLAEEKEKVLIGDVQSTTSETSEHPALQQALEPAGRAASPVIKVPSGVSPRPSVEPTPFREILNLGSCEERVRKFDETREQFYVMESGLLDWLVHLQAQSEHTDMMATNNQQPLLSKTGTQQAASTGVAGAPHKGGPTASHTRRMSIGGMQQLMAGQAGGFGGSGNQVGTKSKELLHAAGAFGNKGMKSGMKLFNKGKNKLRERAAGDKAFF
ncbi:hypothetical protein F5B22DRAFT_560683 [Xylaria bambusicola]|uniref:uncharacterized protein n=1 Tax=Xylaria bambusicola TaxID=326684 RepID=UPI00200898FB|nr:uncharacterized protein F5B22DRAFT_560683 [Xylaria bambusicola]KAI0503224.1 hypothetical protein F5B22DRAFT_560683 [Xylaria bambusicola]